MHTPLCALICGSLSAGFFQESEAVRLKTCQILRNIFDMFPWDKSLVVWHCCVKAASSSPNLSRPVREGGLCFLVLFLPVNYIEGRSEREKWLKGRKWLRLLWKLSGTDLTGGQAGGGRRQAVINGGEKLNSHCNQTADDDDMNCTLPRSIFCYGRFVWNVG